MAGRYQRGKSSNKVYTAHLELQVADLKRMLHVVWLEHRIEDLRHQIQELRTHGVLPSKQRVHNENEESPSPRQVREDAFSAINQVHEESTLVLQQHSSLVVETHPCQEEEFEDDSGPIWDNELFETCPDQGELLFIRRALDLTPFWDIEERNVDPQEKMYFTCDVISEKSIQELPMDCGKFLDNGKDVQVQWTSAFPTLIDHVKYLSSLRTNFPQQGENDTKITDDSPQLHQPLTQGEIELNIEVWRKAYTHLGANLVSKREFLRRVYDRGKNQLEVNKSSRMSTTNVADLDSPLWRALW